MIEGCRFLPWLKEADRKNEIAIGDCGKCKATMPQLQRQALGCGYEPVGLVQINIWRHRGYTGPEPTVCPGYSSSLPEVLETAFSRIHWSKGHPIGDSEDLQTAVIIMDGAFNELQSWLTKPAADGGGGS